MNTQGWTRGLISHNSPIEKFISFVCNTISEEFQFSSAIIKGKNGYLVSFDNYKVRVTIQELEYMQKRDPYTLDKFILENLKTQGLKFDVHRSQYIEYCYGIIY
ncbi:MAG: hypothetical protein ACOX2X_06565 [Peptococcia bacterium]|jgi:hypothetical protein